jgi:uncharacterized protein (DUF1697 family)
MPRYAALLRGVMPTNCRMPELKKSLESAGFTAVKTVIASGNAVFSARRASDKSLATKAEAGMQKVMGKSFMTIVRSIDELQGILDRDYFATVKLPPNAKRNVTFLSAMPKEMPTLPIATKGGSIVGIEGDVAYMYYVPGLADPTFMTMIDKTFNKNCTTRTWDTVGRIVKAAAVE